MTNTTKETIHDLVAELEALRLPELQARYAEALGEATRCPNRRFLMRQICDAWRQRHEEENATNDEEDPRNVEQEDELQGETGAEPDQAECEDGEAADDAPEDDGPTGDVPATTQEALQPNMDSPDVPRQRGRFAGMTIEELQAKYVEVVGRQTHSEHRGYLCWKIREAERGRIPVGPVQARTGSSAPTAVKVLPLRLDPQVVSRMDAAWRSRGIKNRMEFFRRALGHYLEHLGDSEVAVLFSGDAASSQE